MSQSVTVDVPKRTAKEYKAAIEEMLVELRQRNEKMERDKLEIDRLKAQTDEHLKQVWVTLDYVGKSIWGYPTNNSANTAKPREPWGHQGVAWESWRRFAALERLAHELRRLADKVEHNRQTETNEREKFILRLENEMLKSERRLPTRTARQRQDAQMIKGGAANQAAPPFRKPAVKMTAPPDNAKFPARQSVLWPRRRSCAGRCVRRWWGWFRWFVQGVAE